MAAVNAIGRLHIARKPHCGSSGPGVKSELTAVLFKREAAHLLLSSWMILSPSSVSQGATMSITLVSLVMSSASQPVPTTFIFGPNSAEKRATIPSTRLT